MRAADATDTAEATAARSCGQSTPDAGPLTRCPASRRQIVEGEQRRVLEPAIAAVVEHDAAPRALATSDANHLADDRRRAALATELRVGAQRRRTPNHGQMPAGQPVGERERADGDDDGSGRERRHVAATHAAPAAGAGRCRSPTRCTRAMPRHRTATTRKAAAHSPAAVHGNA